MIDNDNYTDKYVNRDWKNTIDTAVSKAKYHCLIKSNVR